MFFFHSSLLLNVRKSYGRMNALHAFTSIRKSMNKQLNRAYNHFAYDTKKNNATVIIIRKREIAMLTHSYYYTIQFSRLFIASPVDWHDKKKKHILMWNRDGNERAKTHKTTTNMRNATDMSSDSIGIVRFLLRTPHHTCPSTIVAITLYESLFIY